jgi:hypothetical protein
LSRVKFDFAFFVLQDKKFSQGWKDDKNAIVEVIEGG